MKIGIPKEIKNNEKRVAIEPAGVKSIVESGSHEVFIETGAGTGSGFLDNEYKLNGAKIVYSAEEAWHQEMVMKVKEPLPEEYKYFRKNLILFTYLHLANEPALTKELIDKEVTAVAYEGIQLSDGSLPLLTPMSEVAGRMATQVGAKFLESTNGGKGILLSGIPGVYRGKVVIIGGGIVGTNAAKIAIGLGADVTILDTNPVRLRELDDLFGKQLNTIISNPLTIAENIKTADLVIGAVLIPGYKAPKIVTDQMVESMNEGSVIVDVAIDQGGIFETIDKITTHDSPTYKKHGVIHYAVPNMPGAVPRTSTMGLTNVTIPYALQLANKGTNKASVENEAIRKGIYTMEGKLLNEAVAEAHSLEFGKASEELKLI